MKLSDLAPGPKFAATFRVHGIPKGQPRPRVAKFGGVYNPKTANGWKDAVAIAARPFAPRAPITAPVRVDIDLLIPRPQRLSRRKDDPGECLAPVKPDVDNVAKGIFDSLTAVGLWVDDAQVCDGRIRKLYHAIGETPGARVTIVEL
jgi:Holliday junction resolvase RusA-like endonuclease